MVLPDGFLLVSVAGALTVRRNTGGVWSATAASAKAALLGQLGALVLFLQTLPSYPSGATIRGHTIYFWEAWTLADNLVLCLALGFAGAMAGRAIAHHRASLTPQSH